MTFTYILLFVLPGIFALTCTDVNTANMVGGSCISLVNRPLPHIEEIRLTTVPDVIALILETTIINTMAYNVECTDGTPGPTLQRGLNYEKGSLDVAGNMVSARKTVQPEFVSEGDVVTRYGRLMQSARTVMLYNRTTNLQVWNLTLTDRLGPWLSHASVGSDHIALIYSVLAESGDIDHYEYVLVNAFSGVVAATTQQPLTLDMREKYGKKAQPAPVKQAKAVLQGECTPSFLIYDSSTKNCELVRALPNGDDKWNEYILMPIEPNETCELPRWRLFKRMENVLAYVMETFRTSDQSIVVGTHDPINSIWFSIQASGRAVSMVRDSAARVRDAEGYDVQESTVYDLSEAFQAISDEVHNIDRDATSASADDPVLNTFMIVIIAAGAGVCVILLCILVLICMCSAGSRREVAPMESFHMKDMDASRRSNRRLSDSHLRRSDTHLRARSASRARRNTRARTRTITALRSSQQHHEGPPQKPPMKKAPSAAFEHTPLPPITQESYETMSNVYTDSTQPLQGYTNIPPGTQQTQVAEASISSPYSNIPSDAAMEMEPTYGEMPADADADKNAEEADEELETFLSDFQ